MNDQDIASILQWDSALSKTVPSLSREAVYLRSVPWALEYFHYNWLVVFHSYWTHNLVIDMVCHVIFLSWQKLSINKLYYLAE